ncbi:hypothetical protein PAXRUDRAFT_18310 [Paxillus rubicundulus Ve08.2h10]|uniref:Uncharacterized protein n=1 Tax=Paxillus rubicundulus Ve08.2h10 TaxID=930991 RepID=A0A0D0BYR6_9AGAM|nr:hypothetical protein PAXRUDRAFT_18310 [Paxillus rubicundulus Ve08.2h10]
MPIKDLFTVLPDFRKQFHDMTTMNQVTVAPTTHVNKLSMRLLKSNNGLIVASVSKSGLV